MKKLLALLMAGAMLLSFAACGGNKEAETTAAPEATTVADAAGEAAGEDETAEAETEIVTNEDGETEVVTKEDNKKEDDGEKPVSQWSKAEIIEYANTALNKVKSAKAGYTKRGVMQINGDVSGLPSWLTSIFQKDNTTTMSKGSDNTNDFPAAGYSWSSKLREQDVKNATIRANGSVYEIRIDLPTEKNPGKGTSSSYGRAVSVIDAAEASGMVPGLKSVDMTYHDGYLKLKVDSRTGNMIEAEISATADAKASVAVIGDVQAKDIKSTEYYTKFAW
ncbi:MAG: hypothetical protein J6L89_08890 [Clostridia bacterium]|nr:hypothetical protein [Clostridia bacterium]